MTAHDVGDGCHLQRQLGRSLRSLRSAAGLSQEAFADQLGIHRTYVGGLERGERNVTLQTVERIAELLGVPALSLLDGTASAATATPTTGRSRRASTSRASRAAAAGRTPSRRRR
jgi:transcriptional regulator with XRE-family HTH domain